MTTLTDRPRAALLVIDVQNDVMSGTHNRDGVIANIAALVDKARAEDVPVVWVQHSGDEMPKESDGWRYVPELTQDPSEPVVHKRYPDAFEETDLEVVLAERKVGRLVVAGAQTDECIRSTLHGAVVRGYDATLVGDAHTTEDLSAWGAPPPDQVIAHTTEDLTEWGAPPPVKVIDHTNLYWGNHAAPGRAAGTVSTGSVTFG